MTAINISLHDLSKKIESHFLKEAAARARAQQGDIPDVPPSTAPGNLVQSQYGVVLSPINMYAQDQQNREAHHMLPQNTAVRARIRSRKSASHGRPLKRSDSGTLRIESLCAGIGLAVLEVLMKSDPRNSSNTGCHQSASRHWNSAVPRKSNMLVISLLPRPRT